jgi:His-Xaa-Ser system protein HxsD
VAKLENLNALGNIKIGEDQAVFSLNPKIYPLELIYSAAYIMIDRAFILLDGDPSEKILVEIRKRKEQQDLKELVMQFNDELLNYAVYKEQSEKNKELREMILQRVLVTNAPETVFNSQETKNIEIDDPENIMKEWEEPEEKNGDKK